MPFCALALITLLSLLPQTAPPGEHGIDKGLHLIGYGSLMGLAVISWARRSWRWWALGLVLSGVGVELLQSFNPARSASMADAISNTAGVLIAWAAGEMLYRRLPRTRRG